MVTTENNSFSSWFAWHYFAILERHYPSLMIPQYIFCRPSFVSVYSTPPPTTNPYNNKKRTYASALSNTTHTTQPNTISPTAASNLTSERSLKFKNSLLNSPRKIQPLTTYSNNKRTYAWALSNTTHTTQPNTISPTAASDLTTERSSRIEKLLAQIAEKIQPYKLPRLLYKQPRPPYKNR